MDQPTVGQLITQAGAKRDAIHVAIAPLKAAEILAPGQRIGLRDDSPGKAFNRIRGGDAIGIVDPFLIEPVMVDEEFYAFLFPQTVRNLRHDWEHPAFPSDAVVNSRAWLTNFANEHGFEYGWNIQSGYDRLMEGINHYIDHGYVSNDDWSGISLTSEFWHHIETVLGHDVLERSEYIPCSC